MKHKHGVLRYIRIAPRKVRVVADTIRGRRVEEALAILAHTPKRAAKPIARMLHSMVANAQEVSDIDRLVIKEIRVDQGPTLKRWLPRAMGRATMIQKKTSHVTLVIDEAR
ncbi:MAG: 50S ribosomal protein L22 [Deltaproteobacteria bacterium]|nr:MAG: 50S ribosomal protein L22 [Deltaproteobacteria bacterium]